MGAFLMCAISTLFADFSEAVITSCAPVFASVIRCQFGAPDVSYDSRGYAKRQTDGIMMKVSRSCNTRNSRPRNQELWTDGNGSEEARADLGGLITATTTRVRTRK